MRAFAATLLALALAPLPAAEVMLYRSEAFVFVLPQSLGDRMQAIAGRESWKHFPDLTRYVDADDDGIDDFVAIALGNDAGYGVQVRYRLRDEGERKLGPWFWSVITDDGGRKVFERFNQ